MKAGLVVTAIVLFGTICFGAPKNDARPVQMAGVVLENRFIAHGVVVDRHKTSERVQKFRLKIEKIEPVPGFVNSGAAYKGKEVEVLSDNNIPASLKSNSRVSVVLRVAGDEWSQSIFLVEVINHE
jgi:hypothetical protein